MMVYTRKSFVVRSLAVVAALLMVGMYLPAMAGATPTTARGTIQGVVMDRTGVPVSDAQVELDNAASGTMADMATTDDTGGYEFDQVKPGKYVLKISADGFLPGKIQDVSVSAGQTTTAVQMKLRAKMASSGNSR